MFNIKVWSKMKKFLVLFMLVIYCSVNADAPSVSFEEFKKIVKVLHLDGFTLDKRLTRESDQPSYKVVYTKGMMLTLSSTLIPGKTKFNTMDMMLLKDKEKSIKDGTLLAGEEFEYKGRKAIFIRSSLGTYVSIILKNKKGLFSVNYMNLDTPETKKTLFSLVDKIDIKKLEK
tara:strand:+ start:164 stop:682 length:519 start_codon:yes stop_codon:yes gene_type:complete